MKTQLLNSAIAFLLAIISLSYSQPIIAQEMKKEWTFLVYLNGKNNLDPFGKMNIKQMETVGSTDKINILVQWGSLSKESVTRHYIVKSKDSSKVTSPVVKDMGKVDMGDYKSLLDFVAWAKENYPAKHYFINVWNHGGGWHRPTDITPSDISWDDETGNKITTEDLGLALKESAKILGQPVDLYASDACLMGMAEVAAEIGDSVLVYGGSQEVEPGEGWPYAQFLSGWSKRPQMTAKEVGKLLSKEYLAAYSGGVYGHSQVTFSVFDQTQLPRFMSEVGNLTQELKASLKSNRGNEMKAALNSAKSFYFSDYKDFMDMISKIDQKAYKFSDDFKSRLKSAHDALVIANDSNISDTHGLSIWAPTTNQPPEYLQRYPNLIFNQKTAWFEFLSEILK